MKGYDGGFFFFKEKDGIKKKRWEKAKDSSPPLSPKRTLSPSLISPNLALACATWRMSFLLRFIIISRTF